MKKTFILRLTAIASILIFIFYVLILCTGNKGSELNNSILKVGEGYLSVPEGKSHLKNWGMIAKLFDTINWEEENLIKLLTRLYSP